jgi:hypothetical protein
MTTRPDRDYVVASQKASMRAALELEHKLAEMRGGGEAARQAAKRAVEAYVAEQTLRIREENPELELEMEGAA